MPSLLNLLQFQPGGCLILIFTKSCSYSSCSSNTSVISVALQEILVFVFQPVLNITQPAFTYSSHVYFLKCEFISREFQ